MRKKDNNLIKVVDPIKGIHYFTNQYRAAIWAEIHSGTVDAIIKGAKSRLGLQISVVDGSDVAWKNIN